MAQREVTEEYRVRVKEVLGIVGAELIRARGLHGPMRSGHEAYGVIKEEVDEMWDEIKTNDGAKALKEAVQVAAMAVSMIVDLTPAEPAAQYDPRS